MINDGHYIDDPVDTALAAVDFEGIGVKPDMQIIKPGGIVPKGYTNMVYNKDEATLEDARKNASFDILGFVTTKYKIAVDREIRKDLDRMVAHLARTHRVTQRHIIEIMEVYSQNKSE